MLVGISPLLSPDLLAALCRMGHGEEIVIADANFPAETLNRHVLRADGLRVVPLLRGILPLLPLDTYVPSALIMMAAAASDALDPAVEASYRQVVDAFQPDAAPITRLERVAFYERARAAHTVVVTGESVKYGNIILKKGVVLPPENL